MNPVGSNTVNSYANLQSTATQAQEMTEGGAASPLKVEQNKVTLSSEGKALLSALQEIEHESKKAEDDNKSVGEKVESFTHGALGMERPDKLEDEDSSYSAGKYVSAALSVGGIILALV